MTPRDEVKSQDMEDHVLEVRRLTRSAESCGMKVKELFMGFAGENTDRAEPVSVGDDHCV